MKGALCLVVLNNNNQTQLFLRKNMVIVAVLCKMRGQVSV